MERFSNAQQHASVDPENESHRVQPSPEPQLSLAWGRIFHRCAEALARSENRATACPDLDVSNAQGVTCTLEWYKRHQEVTNAFSADVDCGPPATRSFSSCVFCAMLHWSEVLSEVFLAGPRCDIPDPPGVARLLDVQCYHEMWPLIPLHELEASAVDITYTGEDGAPATRKVLMHKRRVSESASRGESPVLVCKTCHAAFWASKPYLSKYSLANSLWLGRHPPIFRSATLGHQLLLALGRVVSTKVYLSSKGLDETCRQRAETWRQKFLQSGMRATAIVYGNGSVDHAMSEFPPTPDVLQDTFVAVLSGPEKPVDATLTDAEQTELARNALRKEPEFAVNKRIFDEQARILQATNEVYITRRDIARILSRHFRMRLPYLLVVKRAQKFIPMSSKKG